MHTALRKAARYSPKKAPRRAQRRDEKVRKIGPRELRALTKAQLVALVLELRAQAAQPASGPRDEGTQPQPAPAQAGGTGAFQATSLVINASVRSGQIIEFPAGDVTVIGSVASGAEIVAGGSIHIYGALRGRAIAGTSGDPEARIFCQSLEAELLCIDGRYRVAENFDPSLRFRPVQAHLSGSKMELAPLDESGPVPEAKPAALRIPKRAAERLKLLVALGAAREKPIQHLPIR